MTDNVSGFEDTAGLRWRLCLGDWRQREANEYVLGNLRLSISSDVSIQTELTTMAASGTYEPLGDHPAVVVTAREPCQLRTVVSWAPVSES